MSPQTPWLAMTPFNLRPGVDVDSYRQYSQNVYPARHRRDAVGARVRNLEGLRLLDGTASPWRLVEMIGITSPEEFVRDNQSMPGKAVADDWATLVDDFRVDVCKDLI